MPDPARHRLPLVALAAAALLAGCGGDDENGGAGGPEADRPAGITDQQGGRIELHMPRERVARLLGQEPVLTAEPAHERSSGCEFYAMSGRPLANVWQFCFDRRDEVSLGVTQYSPHQPAPPDDASAARAVLIARGDAICQSTYGDLDRITKRVGQALRELDRTESDTSREAAGRAISRFVANIEGGRERLAVFNAPDDGRDSLEGYLEALQSQAETLGEARDALVAGDDEGYDALGDEFNELANTAQEQARAYGFTTCSASTFG